MRGAAARQQHRSTPQIPTPSPFKPNDSAFMGRRDSDASLCSSRPSSAGGRPQLSAASALLSDRGAQSSALRDINGYLSSVSAPFALKPPLPSARDITDCLRLLLSRLDFPIDPHKVLDDDLLSVLKALNCPVKLNRSALRAPGTPHSWPALVSVLYWLVQLARYADHQFSSSPPRRDPKDILLYTAESYSLFISGKDDAVAELDNEYIGEMERGAANAAASVEALEKEAAELERKVMEIRSGVSPKEQLERERDLLIEDSKKFESVVGNFNGQVEALEEKLRDFEKELEAKVMESKRICEENEELKKTIEGQAVNARDVEMMRRELQAVERDIAEAENGRSVMDEKAWELEAQIGKKWKELVAMAEQCNQAIRKLKLGDDLHYTLNPQGSSPAEIMGIDYKNILKPSLAALSEETQKGHVSKVEALRALRQQFRENDAMLEVKKESLAPLQAKINEGEAWVSLLKKEIEDYTLKSTAEAEKVQQEFTRKENELSMVEQEGELFIKSCEQKLEEAIRETEEETQQCARELLALIDEVSEYKESTEKIASRMKTEVIELAKFLGESKGAAVLAKLHDL